MPGLLAARRGEGYQLHARLLNPQLARTLHAIGFDRVYDLGTNWRAELSHTPRHLSEHRTIAPEMAFITDERDVMRLDPKPGNSCFGCGGANPS